MNNLILSDEINKNTQFLCFNVGKKKYAIPAFNVIEIIELPLIETTGNKNPNTIGFLNFNNLLINLIDIRLYLQEEIEKYSVSNKVILAKTDEIMFGIIADSVEKLVENSNNTIRNISDNDNTSLIENISTYNNEQIYLLNLRFIENLIKNTPNSQNDYSHLFANDEHSIEIFNQRHAKLIERFNNLTIQNVFYENKFVTFLLDNTTFCLNLDYTKEFIPLGNITPLPYTPDYIEGLICVKGEFITILNLKKFLNYSECNYTKKSKVIILNSKDYKLGLLVDDIYEIISIPEEHIQTSEISSCNNYISEEYIDETSVKPILNIQNLIRDERLCINAN